jgi:hypothetical protein
MVAMPGVVRNSGFMKGCQEPRTIVSVLTRMWKNRSVALYAPWCADVAPILGPGASVDTIKTSRV